MRYFYQASQLDIEKLKTFAEEYRKQNPEIDEMLNQFGISQEEFEKYIALTATPPAVERSMSSTQGYYDANVSRISGQY